LFWTTVSAARVGSSFVRLYGVQQNRYSWLGSLVAAAKSTPLFPFI
jgi:hypothetical protein